MNDLEMMRTEVITRGNCPSTAELAPGIELRPLVAGALGSRGLFTGLVSFRPGAELPYHTHPCSEVVIVLAGEANTLVEGRRYRLRPYDAIHLPAGTPHCTCNPSVEITAVLHSSFASDTPSRDAITARFAVSDRTETNDMCPEHLTRFESAPVYELAPAAFFRDLFARRFGCRGICGGYGVFQPGASLPCHYHAFDESITIVAGRAVCQVAGREYDVGDCDTVCVPLGRPHRFLNRSDRPMAMIWVYAGDEPERTLVDPGYCEGRGDPAIFAPR